MVLRCDLNVWLLPSSDDNDLCSRVPGSAVGTDEATGTFTSSSSEVIPVIPKCCVVVHDLT